jgi:hypothetical protein
MKVKQEILDRINNPETRMRIGLEIGCGDRALAVQIQKNKINGRLTKMDALLAISKETGETVENILEEEVSEQQS